MSEMKIKVRLDPDSSSLSAEAKITLNKQTTDFSFILSKSLTLTECLCSKNPVKINTDSEIQPLFRAVSNRIILQSDTPFSVIEIKYSGSINGWLNIISDEIISLNWYSVWFPQELSEDAETDRAEISGCENYTLIKGEYDTDRNIWRYGGQGFDQFNLILYKKSALKITESRHVSVFYTDSRLERSAELSKNIYEDILEYYTKDLFKCDFNGHIDIACLYPQIKSGGAFKRRGLICCPETGSSESNIIPLCAHELAHEWCEGADITTWEDWLNETAAEWSMLLYALSRGKKDIFIKQIENHQASYPTYPAVKTPDGNRPDGVHTKGTVIFYDLFKQYGADTVKQIIFLFVNLKIKNTESLFEEMRRAGLSSAADFLNSRILLP